LHALVLVQAGFAADPADFVLAVHGDHQSIFKNDPVFNRRHALNQTVNQDNSQKTLGIGPLQAFNNRILTEDRQKARAILLKSAFSKVFFKYFTFLSVISHEF